MQRIVVRSPLSSINKVLAVLLERGVTAGRMTVSRRLSREFGLKSYKPARKPRLAPAMKAKRLAFAKKHQAGRQHSGAKSCSLMILRCNNS